MSKCFLFGIAATALLLAACSDAPSPRERRAEAMAIPPLPAMSGSETFAEGQLLVEARISRGDRPFAGKPGGAGGDRARGGGEGRRAWRHREDGEGGFGGADSDGEARPRIQASHMPTVVIKLQVTNRGTAPIDIVWVECNSALGNFGVFPEKMTVAPSESAETEPMRSQLGASGEDMPVSVTLRVHGKQEKKTFIVRAQSEGASAPKS